MTSAEDRPVEGETREDVFRVRLTTTARGDLDALAERWGGTASDLVRAWIAEGRLPPAPR